MSRDIMIIEKSLIPYDFNIALGNEEFNFRVDYNHTGRFFTLELKKNGETLCSGDPIVYGRKLFTDVRNAKFPTIEIVPVDLSGTYKTVTFQNLGDGVLLVVDDGTLEE